MEAPRPIRSSSHYISVTDDEHFTYALTGQPASEDDAMVASKLLAFTRKHPCIGARQASRNHALRISVLPVEMNDPLATATMAADLAVYAHEADDLGRFPTFIATFTGSPTSERSFEAALWRQLRSLHDVDGSPWDAEVSADPTDPTFSFSFAGRSYFIVGLHQGASRPARRFSHQAMVFNRHDRFQLLRETGRLPKWQSEIRARDEAIAGQINPNLADFGDVSDAAQYSGRRVEAGWQCPFRTRAS